MQRTFVHHVYATLARTPYNLDANGAYQASAHTYGRAPLRSRGHMGPRTPERGWRPAAAKTPFRLALGRTGSVMS